MPRRGAGTVAARTSIGRLASALARARRGARGWRCGGTCGGTSAGMPDAIGGSVGFALPCGRGQARPARRRRDADERRRGRSPADTRPPLHGPAMGPASLRVPSPTRILVGDALRDALHPAVRARCSAWRRLCLCRSGGPLNWWSGSTLHGALLRGRPGCGGRPRRRCRAWGRRGLRSRRCPSTMQTRRGWRVWLRGMPRSLRVRRRVVRRRRCAGVICRPAGARCAGRAPGSDSLRRLAFARRFVARRRVIGHHRCAWPSLAVKRLRRC
jgi:hypothetical protein